MTTSIFDEAIKRRLGIIDQWGADATAAAQNQANQQAAQAAQNVFTPGPTTYAPVAEPINSGHFGFNDTFSRFLNAIKGQESSGNYGAHNGSSGALGAYQIMPGNLPSWSREAIGRSISPGEFLHNPALQDAIASHFLKQYYDRWGPEGAAVAWYAGPGAVSKYLRNKGYGGSQGAYPTINQYALQILHRMGLR